MILRSLTFIFLATTMVLSTPCKAEDKPFKEGVKEFFGMSMPKAPPSVRILLAENQDHVLVEAKSGYRVYDPLEETRLRFGMFSKKFIIKCLP